MKITTVEELVYVLNEIQNSHSLAQLEDGVEVTIETDGGNDLFVYHPADQPREHWTKVTIFPNTNLIDMAERIVVDLTYLVAGNAMYKMKCADSGPN